MRMQHVKARKKKPLIVICSEGGKNTSEEIYLKNFRSRNLRIQFSFGNSTDSRGMLENLKNYIKNEDLKSEENCKIFLILDTDLDNSKINMIKSIIDECNNNKIEVITSSPTFEIWYLMHFRSNKLVFSSSKDVKKELGTIINVYHESMNVFPLIISKMENAKKIARKIERAAGELNDELINHNPHSSVFKVIDAIDEYNCIH